MTDRLSIALVAASFAVLLALGVARLLGWGL